MYFVITPSEGEVFISPATEEELAQHLASGDGEYDDTEFVDLDYINRHMNFVDWPEDTCLIIKGEIVQPVASKTLYRLPSWRDT
jgi:hypothetical protein